ncbi:aldehyde dehydrogenase (NAD+) [Clostridium collagenovorans DSM 3089]|uniref:Aldehyde dehydrogenase n=1 Tax=Clostridium collagenovorans DSM 3089 TaxID=1121306 RepID=A0A1M5XJM4_9CLOT|nr:aldehyde dehydrogenase [Clostridium collagenovorans]SHH99714.1 aldehyde dehydrogenase (NAD+) [Clostridium collagenovorans DSM 3089]
MKNLNEILDNQRAFFLSGKTMDIEFRIEQLNKLRTSIIKHEEDILDALKKDLNKSNFESYETELGIVLEEITLMSKNIRKWSKDKKVKSPLMHYKTDTYIHSEPYGVVLNIAPWNYPFQLLMAPLIGIIAGGNCAMLKPSKYSISTSKVIEIIIREAFDENYITVVEAEGGRESIQALLQLRFDYIFFTGSVDVGKVVMENAAKHLTPVTLELGGKSPCIVCKDAKLEIAAKRIVWGKFLNAGQTCVAPDYLLVHKNVKEELLKNIKKNIIEFFGENPKSSNDFGRIITNKHVERLASYLSCGSVYFGGKYDVSEKYMEPTILTDISFEDAVMQEEIFGPIFPVIEFEDIDDVINILKHKEKPLALYLFTESKEIENKVVKRVSYGGGCINDTIIHVASSYAPFGGVGNSGMGAYHGKYSFDLFTHQKSILKKSSKFDIKVRYAPYKDKLNLLKKIMK